MVPNIFSIFALFCIFRSESAGNGFIKNERVCKPGSVISSHLSRRIVAGTLKPPPRNGRADHMFLHGVAPDRVYSIELSPADACALTARFHPYSAPRERCKAVSFCCTCPRVAPGGCYPLSSPYGARTFLTHSLSARARDCSTRSKRYFTHLNRFRQGKTFL